MGTKLSPGGHDCYANALPDEPMFVLLARDPIAPFLVSIWAKVRMADAEAATAVFRKMLDTLFDTYWTAPEVTQAGEALGCALAMFDWRKNNDGRWREPLPAMNAGQTGTARLIEVRSNGEAVIELNGAQVIQAVWTGARMPTLGRDPRDERRGLVLFEGGAADPADVSTDAVCVSLSADGIEAIERDLQAFADELRRSRAIDHRFIV